MRIASFSSLAVDSCRNRHAPCFADPRRQGTSLSMANELGRRGMLPRYELTSDRIGGRDAASIELLQREVVHFASISDTRVVVGLVLSL